jgi:L-fuconate dehydratase
MERNVLEYADHLHEHFLYPCSISKKGRYNVPNNPAEGYRLYFIPVVQLERLIYDPSPARSIEMHKSSIAEYEWPNGSYWRKAEAE